MVRGVGLANVLEVSIIQVAFFVHEVLVVVLLYLHAVIPLPVVDNKAGLCPLGSLFLLEQTLNSSLLLVLYYYLFFLFNS